MVIKIKDVGQGCLCALGAFRPNSRNMVFSKTGHATWNVLTWVNKRMSYLQGKDGGLRRYQALRFHT